MHYIYLGMLMIDKQKKRKKDPIRCTKKHQAIGVTVHSHCVESFEGLLQRYVGEKGVAVNCEKTHFFKNTQ